MTRGEVRSAVLVDVEDADADAAGAESPGVERSVAFAEEDPDAWAVPDDDVENAVAVHVVHEDVVRIVGFALRQRGRERAAGAVAQRDDDERGEEARAIRGSSD